MLMASKSRTSPDILLEICQKNGWRHPLYTLHSILGPEDETLFLYKVTIEAMAVTYQPNKLSQRLDEAYYLAASYTLEQLGFFIKPITPKTKHTLHYGLSSNFPADCTISAPGHSMLTSSSPAEPIVSHTPEQPFPDSGLFLSSPPPLAPIRSHCYGSSSSPADCTISAPGHSMLTSSRAHHQLFPQLGIPEL